MYQTDWDDFFNKLETPSQSVFKFQKNKKTDWDDFFDELSGVAKPKKPSPPPPKEEKKKKRDKFMSFESYWGKSIGGQSDPEFQEAIKRGGAEFASHATKPLEAISRGLAGITYFPITRTAENLMQGKGVIAKDLLPIPFVGRDVWASDLLKEAGMKEGWLRDALGIGIDIFGDPLTYVTGGMSKAGKLASLEKLAKPGSKVASKIAKLRKAGKYLELGETTAEQIARGQRGMRWMGKAIAPKTQAEIYEKALKPAGEALKGIEETMLGKWHLSRYTGPERMRVIQEMITAEKHNRPDIIEAIGKSFKKRKEFTKGLAEKYGASVDEVEGILTQMSELKPPPGTPAFKGIQYGKEEAFNPELLGRLSIDTEAVDFANDIKKTMRKMAEKEIGAGVLKKSFDDEIIDYMTHLITPEARKAMKGGGFERFKKKIVDMFHPSTKHRVLMIPTDPTDLELMKKLPKMAWKEKKKLLEEGKIKWPAISEANQMAREGLLIPGKQIEQFFYEDPAKITAIRQLRSEKALASVRIMENARDTGLKEGWALEWKKPSQLDAILDEGEKVIPNKKPPIPEGYDLVKSPLTQDVVFKQDVADVLNATQELFNDSKRMAGLARAYKKTLQWWKIWTLMPFPSYHFRNVFGGNMFNQTLAGMNPIKESWLNIGNKKLGIREGANLTAGKVQRINTWKNRGVDLASFPKKAKKWFNEALTTDTGRKYTLNQIDDLARETGIYRAGQYTADIFEVVPSFFKETGKSVNPLKTWNFFTTHGMQVGNALEDNAKLGLFIHALREGLDPADAARKAHKYIFDYFDIPKSVENAKNFLPFITWYYKNIPLQLEHMVKKPAIFHSLYKTKRGITGEKEIPQSVMTEYYKDSYPVVFQKKDGKARWAGLGRWLPVTDINMVSDPKEWASMLWPGVKTPIEMTFNRELYFNQPIFSTEEEPVNRRQMYGTYMPNWMAYLLKQHRATSTLDRLNPFGIWGTEKKGGLFGLGQKRGGKWEMPEGARWIREATGLRTYETDVKQAIDTRINVLQRQRAKYRGMLKWQVDEKEKNKLKKKINKIRDEIRELKQTKY